MICVVRPIDYLYLETNTSLMRATVLIVWLSSILTACLKPIVPQNSGLFYYLFGVFYVLPLGVIITCYIMIFRGSTPDSILSETEQDRCRREMCAWPKPCPLSSPGL